MWYERNWNGIDEKSFWGIWNMLRKIRMFILEKRIEYRNFDEKTEKMMKKWHELNNKK